MRKNRSRESSSGCPACMSALLTSTSRVPIGTDLRVRATGIDGVAAVARAGAAGAAGAKVALGRHGGDCLEWVLNRS